MGSLPLFVSQSLGRFGIPCQDFPHDFHLLFNTTHLVFGGKASIRIVVIRFAAWIGFVGHGRHLSTLRRFAKVRTR
jgi:hypothetical protein